MRVAGQSLVVEQRKEMILDFLEENPKSTSIQVARHLWSIGLEVSRNLVDNQIRKMFTDKILSRCDLDGLNSYSLHEKSFFSDDEPRVKIKSIKVVNSENNEFLNDYMIPINVDNFPPVSCLIYRI